MKYIEEIVGLYNYIKKLEQENKELKIQLTNIREDYSKLNKEIIDLELENKKLKKEGK